MERESCGLGRLDHRRVPDLDELAGKSQDEDAQPARGLPRRVFHGAGLLPDRGAPLLAGTRLHIDARVLSLACLATAQPR